MANPIRVINTLTNVEDAIGDFIANGPSTGIQGHVRDAYRHRCRELANLPGWARALGVGRGPFTRVCQPYWDDNGWDGPVLPPPDFTGGQCDDIVYDVQWVTSRPGLPNNSFGAQRLGPISVSRELNPGDENAGCGEGQTFNRFTLKSGGTDVGIDSGCDVQLVSITVTPLFGEPDVCGDPPPGEPVPGPNPPPDPGPIPGPEPTDNPRDPIGLPDIPIPPYDDPVYGPTPIETPEDSPAGGGPPSGGDGLPGSPDAIGSEAGGVAGGEPGEDVDLGEPPAGSVWVGVLVEATVDPRYGTIPSTGPDNTVYPSTIGNASLIYQGGRGTNVRVLSRFTELFRPVTALVLTGCRVSALPGVSLTVRGISALSCPDNPCEETDG